MSSRVWVQFLWHITLTVPCMQVLAGQGLKPISPALVGGFFTTEPSGKPSDHDP